MRRLFPSPLLSLGLFVLWILLMQSVDPGTLLLGLLQALFWPRVTVGLRPEEIRARKPLQMLRLFGRVVLDMLRSNAAVAFAILFPRKKGLRSGFLRIPLELKEPEALAVLAMIITFTPGTAWVELAADRRLLLLHVLAIDDEEALIQHIKSRYERPLLEIFQ